MALTRDTPVACRYVPCPICLATRPHTYHAPDGRAFRLTGCDYCHDPAWRRAVLDRLRAGCGEETKGPTTSPAETQGPCVPPPES